ncbi:MAG: ABC transporter permease [Opitutaceae bacterium]|nr:ABC transporter permease [Opitutaceae bacterium]
MPLLLRHALRSLLKSPGFTLVAILTLSLGIGATTTLYSVFSVLVLNPTRLADPTALVQLWVRNPERNFNAPSMSWPRFEEIRRQQTVFSDVAVSAFGTFNLVHNGEPEQLTGLYATSGFLNVLGVAPAHGRTFTAEEDLSGSAPVVILSHELWQTRFGGRENLVGQPVLLSGTSYTVIGILPPLLSNPYGNVQLIATRPNEFAGLTPQQVSNGAGYLQTIARLKPGVSIEQAEAEIATLTHHYTTAFAERLDGRNETLVVRFVDALVGNVRPTFNLLIGVVALVLLIACANVSNLFLGRLSARQREIGIRLSLGATRRQLVQQFLLESLLFSGASALLAVVVAIVSLESVQRLSANLLAPGTELRVDLSTLGFTLLVGAVCAALVGLVPAFQASRSDLAEVLKDAAARSQSGGVRGGRFRSALVVVEVALSVVLLVASGLLLLSFIRLQSTPPGFNPQGVASALVSIPAERYRTPEQQADFFRQVIERLRDHPQVSSAAAAVGLPLSGFAPQSPYSIRGRDILPLPQRPLAGLRIVTEDYFKTMGIPLREGRAFSAQDRAGAPGVCILNESLARRLFPGQSAIGQVILRGRDADIPGEIVGIVGDVKTVGLAAPPPDEVYWPSAQLGRGAMALVARTQGDPTALQAVLRSAVASVDPSQPLSFFTTLDGALTQSLGFQRITAYLTGTFATLALLLAAVGLYSVLAFTVTQRTVEIGVRMALGAQPTQVVRLILRQGLRLVAVGLVVGVALAAGLSRLIASLLFGIEPFHVGVYAGVAGVFTVVGVLACLLPSWRASRIDPLEALRSD